MKSVPLTQGFYALVDDEDYQRVSAFKWYAQINRRRVYARRNVKVGDKWTIQSLHCFLIPTKDKVDHRDGNGLNNRRYNLRVATTAQNNSAFQSKRAGSSKFRGVSWFKPTKSWKAYINVNRKKVHLGYYPSEIDAAYAYDSAAQRYHGEFASPNFPELTYHVSTFNLPAEKVSG